MSSKPDEQAFVALGYAAGRAFGSMVEAFMQGFADHWRDAGAQPPELVNVEPKAEEKTCIADCRSCWCDDCARVETCQMGRDGVQPDGIAPLPCIGCMNGMRFRPKDREPCGGYEPLGEPVHG